MTRPATTLLLLPATLLLAGCVAGGDAAEAPDDDAFSTSGSPAADQRAEQQLAAVAKVEETAEATEQSDEDLALDPQARKSLHDRLGGDKGVGLIVDDFLPRLLADPRVNLQRRGLEDGWIHAAPEPWEPTPTDLLEVKRLMVAFVSLAAGGPAAYDGPPIVAIFRDRAFTNLEFDSATGDLQASLDNLGVADQEQKELLAIFETLREQTVTSR